MKDNFWQEIKKQRGAEDVAPYFSRARLYQINVALYRRGRRPRRPVTIDFISTTYTSTVDYPQSSQ